MHDSNTVLAHLSQLCVPDSLPLVRSSAGFLYDFIARLTQHCSTHMSSSYQTAPATMAANVQQKIDVGGGGSVQVWTGLDWLMLPFSVAGTHRKPRHCDLQQVSHSGTRQCQSTRLTCAHSIQILLPIVSRISVVMGAVCPCMYKETTNGHLHEAYEDRLAYSIPNTYTRSWEGRHANVPCSLACQLLKDKAEGSRSPARRQRSRYHRTRPNGRRRCRYPGEGQLSFNVASFFLFCIGY